MIYAEEIATGKSIRAMTVDEIYQLVEKFAEGCWRLQQADFDCVELHAAHGYLIAQFMSPYVNMRNDRFGGSFINRMRFILEIISRIKQKCGKDFLLQRSQFSLKQISRHICIPAWLFPFNPLIYIRIFMFYSDIL